MFGEVFKLFGTVGMDTKEVDKGMDNLTKKLNNTAKKWGDVGKKMTLKVTVPIVGMMAGFAKASMDLEATEAKYNTVFEGMTDVADDFIKDFQKLTPATTAQARSMSSGIQDLLVPMGFMREEATKMTADTMHLVGALANFNSGTHTAEDVANAFQSALTGSTESLKRLGIQVDQDTIKQKAYEMGLVKVGEEMDKQSRAQALMQLAYEQSGDALTAYTEENLDTKTQMGLLKAEVIDMASTFGDILLPIIRDVVAWLRQGVEWFSNLDEGVKRNILIIGGLVASIGPMILVGKTLISIVSGIISTIKVAGVVMGAVTSPIGLVILAVGALIAIGVLLWKNWDTITEKAGELWGNIKDRFTKIGDAIMQPIEKAKDFVKKMIDNIKSFFNFKWSLPKLKMPKIDIKGKFSLLPPSVPKFGIKWNKDGGILNDATIFGASGNTLLGGGEAGREAVLPLTRDVLGGIGDGIVNSTDMSRDEIVTLIKDGFHDVVDMLARVVDVSGHDLVLDTGMLAGELTPKIDKRLGEMAERKKRGG